MGQGFQFNQPLKSEQSSFGPLPVGDYVVMLTSADSAERTTRNGLEQQIIQLRYTVQEGDYAGRVIFNDLLVGGANSEKAREFSLRHIREIGWALGLPYITNTNELLNQPFVLEVSISEREGYSPRNEVRRAKKLSARPQQETSYEDAGGLDF